MNQYIFSSNMTWITTIALVAVVYFSGKRSKPIAAFCFYMFNIFAWSFGWSRMASAQDPVSGLFWARALHIGAIIIPTAFFKFSLLLISERTEKSWSYLVKTGYAISLFFLSICFTTLFVPKTGLISGIPHYPQPGPAYIPYVIYFAAYSCLAFWAISKSYRESVGLKKNQMRYVLLAYSIAWVGGCPAFLPVFGLPMWEYSFYGVILCMLLLTYTVLTQRLLDMSLMLRWGLAYGTSLLIVSISFIMCVLFIEKIIGTYFQTTKGFPSLISACVAILIFDPTRKKITKFVDKFIFRSPDLQHTLTGIEGVLISQQSINELTAGLSTQFKNIWEVNHAGFAIWNPVKAKFNLAPENVFIESIITRIKEDIGQSDFLVRTLETEKRLFPYGIVVEEELTALGNRALPGERTTFWKMRRTMRWLGAAICIPLSTEDKLLGFIILGKKKNDVSYNSEDKKFLSHVSQLVSRKLTDYVFNY